MAVTLGSAAAVTYTTADGTSLNVSLASGIVSGDLLVLLSGQKPNTANSGSLATPAGWSRTVEITGAGGYGATLAADTGNTNLRIFTKVADGTESSLLSLTLASNSVSWATTARLTKTLDEWSLAGATGSDATGGSLVSVSFGSDPGIASNDFIFGAFNIPTDVQTPNQFEGLSLAQTGAVFATVVEIIEPDSGNGLDIGGVIFRTSVTSGTGSGNPLFTGRASGTVTNVRGPAVIIRIRDQIATVTSGIVRQVMMHEPYIGGHV